jgi:hypothetical protein
MIQLVAITLVALSMGVHFGTWLTERPIRRTQSVALFTEIHQGRDAVATSHAIPGNAAILFIVFEAFLFAAIRQRSSSHLLVSAFSSATWR